ncbi:MAG: hypothetical protein GX424_03345 [Clostridiales bacterium]|nr:hypothetical protein [Clostridiales bacterium]
MKYLEKFYEQEELIQRFTEDGAYLSWVMGIYLDRDDVDELASDCLTDSKNDKKIDFINVDEGLGKITIAQGYYSTKERDVAPSNKASDLNTALAWLTSGDLHDIPENLREIIKSCRELMEDQEISSIEILYVHNLPESENCRKELETAANHLKSLLSDEDIEVKYNELGSSSIEELYIRRESPIIIRDKISIPVKPIYTESSTAWDAYVFSVTGDWLSNLYKSHADKLFSANYRGFLGAGKRKKINNAIQQSAEKDSTNFWVFNNGITVLTLGVDTSQKNVTIIEGISIINGAQTTGSIGSLRRTDQLGAVKILCCVIKCNDPDLIPQIVKANNSQNSITSWDVYSNDPVQISLKEKFLQYGKDYSVKRGFDNFNNELSIFNVSQPVLAFEGNYRDASRGKNYILQNNTLYEQIFNRESKARHILLALSLSNSIYAVKSKILNKSSLNANEQQALYLFSNLKFKMLFLSLLARTLSIYTEKTLDVRIAAISQEYATKSVQELARFFEFFTEIVLDIMVTHLGDKNITEYANDKAKFEVLSKEVNDTIAASRRFVQDTSKIDILKIMIWNG